MQLVMSPMGKEMKVTKVIADEKTKKHLENLGLIKGTELSMLGVNQSGIVIKIFETRLALSEEIARRIFVEMV